MKNIIQQFRKKYELKEPISLVTCYDFTFARLLNESNVDCLLVGDSLGMVVQGHETTLPVTLEEMIYHTKAVCKGAPDKTIVADLPFLSYQVSVEDGIRAAGRLMKETSASCVKIEGDSELIVNLTHRLTEMGIPVFSHLGLTPQSLHTLGGHKVQGKTEASQNKMKQKALELQEVGSFALLLEMIPAQLGKEITDLLRIPTIGIGAGVGTSGQVLVLTDLLGLQPNFNPKFLKKYGDLGTTVIAALNQYHKEVSQKNFPDENHSF